MAGVWRESLGSPSSLPCLDRSIQAWQVSREEPLGVSIPPPMVGSPRRCRPHSLSWRRRSTLTRLPSEAPKGIDFKVKTISLNDTTVQLQIWDTAGQERFHTFTTSFFRGAHGFVLVYDITSLESFQGIAHWMKDIYEKADETVEVILLGNKCDKEMERVIPKNRGEKLAWEYGIPFFETSAKDNINIDNAFSVLAEEILNKSSCVLLDVDVVNLTEKAQKRTCCRL